MSTRQLGPANGTDDSSWLNDLLAGGGDFRGTPGQTYRISVPLAVRSGSTLDMTGCTVAGTKAGAA